MTEILSILEVNIEKRNVFFFFILEKIGKS